jgi:WD40 repeat protein
MRQGRILTLLTDAERLLLVYKTPIIHGALHVYYSALVTMPSCLLLEETALHDGHGIPVLVTKRAPGWGLRETILEAESIVSCIAYSPNSKLIASVSLTIDEVQVWDVATGTSLHKMSVPDAEVDASSYFTSIAFSPNSQWVASASTDRTVRLWDVVTGSQHHVMRGHTSWARCVAFSPDGTIIVSGSDDSTLRIWDVGTGAERLTMTGHTATVKSLAFAPDGQTIVSASRDGTLRVWDVHTGTELHIMAGDEEELRCVAFSPNGATIASGSHTETLQLWSATSSTQQHALEGHTLGVRSLAFSPDSRSIVSCDGVGVVRIWDVTTGIEKWRVEENYVVSTVTYSSDGKSFAMGLWAGTIRIRDANTSVATHSGIRLYGGDIEPIVFSPGGLLIAFQTGYGNQTVRIWDVITGTERHVVEVGCSVYSIAFSPDNRTIACGQSNGAVQVWDVASGSKQSSMIASGADSVAFSSDGNSLVSYSSWDGVAHVWDVATGANRHILTRPVASEKLSMSVAFSADGTVITARESHGICAVIGFWDITTARPKYTESTSSHEQTPATDDFHTSKQHRFEGYSSAWIRHHVGQEEPTYICWIPQEHRGTLAYNGTKVCIGAEDSDGTGMIMILDFSPVEILQHTV